MVYAQDEQATKTIEETQKQIQAYYSKAMRRIIAEFEATYDKLLNTAKDGKPPTVADLYKLDKYWQLQGQLRAELQKMGDIKLTCTLNASAATTSGVATLKISGNYWNGDFGAANNTLTVQYRYKVKDGSYTGWTSATATATGNKYDITATISGLNYLNAYTFQARAIDKLSTVESNEQTRKTTPIFDWSEDDFNFNVNTTVKGDLSVSGGVSATGALVADSVSANSIKLNSKDIFSLLYPVGSVYISVNNTNPSTLFGGTWEQIKDKFLLAAGSTYNAGSTGGEATHTLTVSELPAHNHGIWYPNAGAGNNSAPIGYPNVGSKSTYWAVGSYTADVGTGEAHNNMPPYLAVYVWKRTK